jgi:hypothetical protein
MSFLLKTIPEDENGLCLACRKMYPKNPTDFKPPCQEEVTHLKAEKTHKNQQRDYNITKK